MWGYSLKSAIAFVGIALMDELNGSMNTSLQQAIERVYDAFRDVPKPKTVEGCPCCVDEKGIRPIPINCPLR